MIIEEKIKELEQLKKEVPVQAKKIALKYKGVILDYIREKQLYEKGINGKGQELLKYKPFTIAFKKIKNQPNNRTTLFDTGDFYKSFDLIYTDQNSIGVFARDEKTPDLVAKYGADIFIFTVDNIKEINTTIFEHNLIAWLLKTKTFTQI